LRAGKNNLVVLNKSFDEILVEVTKRLGVEVAIGGVSGALTHFVIEEFLPHEEEYYISVTSTREGTALSNASINLTLAHITCFDW
jgi:succinyl-CoA synthetase beta subunit